MRWNTPQMELFFGQWSPCSMGLPCLIRVLETHLYQCSSLCCCERLHSALVNFFWRFFEHFCPFHDGWLVSAFAHTTLSIQQFLTKNGMAPMLYPPCSPDITLNAFLFCFSNKKSPQKGKVCHCGRGEPKNGRGTKRWVQHLFWAVEKNLW